MTDISGEVRAFLAAHHPFDLLPAEVIDELAGRVESGEAGRDAVIVEPGDSGEFLYVVYSGAVETRSEEGFLLGRLGEGEVFGLSALLGNGRAVNRVTALEDTRFYRIPETEFERLVGNHREFAYYFAPYAGDRLRGARHYGPAEPATQLDLMSIRAGDLVTREPVVVETGATVRDAARIMREHRVSCLPVCGGGALRGIVTDTDLRNRVIAEGLGFDAPVDDVMTAKPETLDWEDSAFDALLVMTRRNVRHLPILKGGRLAGLVTTTNLVRQQTHSAVYMVGDIYKQADFDGLAGIVSQIPQLLRTMVQGGSTAYNVGHIVTGITDATANRLMQLAEKRLGPPPVPYLWLASGSQARFEQTGVSDQDNCMILDDSYDEAKHGAYFAELAQFVADGLNAAGYVYCPGEMMATIDKWRQPLSVWKKYFRGWIEEPEPMALMLSSVFFDLRPVHGEAALFEDLQRLILERARANRLFIAHMVGNALKHEPPLGFFRNFVLIRGGEHDHQLDLKHAGVVPIVDIARIYALEGGIAEVNTLDRLRAESDARVLSPQGTRDLRDAYEFIATTRLKHQARQIGEGRKPDNYMMPEELSQFERSHLKDAFSVVKTIQSALANAYNASYL